MESYMESTFVRMLVIFGFLTSFAILGFVPTFGAQSTHMINQVLAPSSLDIVQLYNCQTAPNTNLCPSANYQLYLQYCASNSGSNFCPHTTTKANVSKTTIVTTTIYTATTTVSNTGISTVAAVNNNSSMLQFCYRNPLNPLCTTLSTRTNYSNKTTTFNMTNFCKNNPANPLCTGYKSTTAVVSTAFNMTNFCKNNSANPLCTGSSINTVPGGYVYSTGQTGTSGDSYAQYCNVNGQASYYCSPYLSYQYDISCGGANAPYCGDGSRGFGRYQYTNMCQAFSSLKYCQTYQGTPVLFNLCSSQAYSNYNSNYYQECNNYLQSQSYTYDQFCYSNAGSTYCNPAGTQGFRDWQYGQYCSANSNSEYCQPYISSSLNPYYQYSTCQKTPNAPICNANTASGQQQQLSNQYVQFCQTSGSLWCVPSPNANGFQIYEHYLFCQGNSGSQYCAPYMDPSLYAGCPETTKSCQNYLQSESYAYSQYCSFFGGSGSAVCSPSPSEQGYELYLQNQECNSNPEGQYCQQLSYTTQQLYSQGTTTFDMGTFCKNNPTNPLCTGSSTTTIAPAFSMTTFCKNNPTNPLCTGATTTVFSMNTFCNNNPANPLCKSSST